MLFVSSLAHRLFPDRYRCLSRAHRRFVGWAERSDAHHPDRSDPENIQRHRPFMGGHHCAHTTLLATRNRLP